MLDGLVSKYDTDILEQNRATDITIAVTCARIEAKTRMSIAMEMILGVDARTTEPVPRFFIP